MARVIILVDTPNIGKSVIEKHGQRARPDYRALRYMAAKFGTLTRARALVNDGVNPRFAAKLADFRFEVEYSHAFDCDHALIACAVKLREQADYIVICSGDKHYIPLVQLLLATGTRIVVCAVEGTCNATLKRLANFYEEMPVQRWDKNFTCYRTPTDYQVARRNTHSQMALPNNRS
jgi:hypothetical protein